MPQRLKPAAPKSATPMRLLSIDFDYWVDGFDEWERSEPEEGREWATFAWALRSALYASNGRNIERAMPLSPDWMRDAQTLAASIKPGAIRVIGERHSEIWPLLEHCQCVELWSVDAHHDCGYSEEGQMRGTTCDAPDSGNWLLRAVASLKVLSATLVLPPLELAAAAKLTEGLGERLRVTSLHGEEFPAFDAVFLCRSPEWVPPNYDFEFGALARALGMTPLPCRNVPMAKQGTAALCRSAYGR